MSVADFREAARAGLKRAGDRVEAKLGFRCTGALQSLSAMEAWTDLLRDEEILTILEDPRHE